MMDHGRDGDGDGDGMEMTRQGGRAGWLVLSCLVQARSIPEAAYGLAGGCSSSPFNVGAESKLLVAVRF